MISAIHSNGIHATAASVIVGLLVAVIVLIVGRAVMAAGRVQTSVPIVELASLILFIVIAFDFYG